VVSDGASVTSCRSHYKPLGTIQYNTIFVYYGLAERKLSNGDKSKGVRYGFAAVFNFFDYPILRKGCPYSGLTIVPLGRELVSSHRLSIQTTLVSGTVWPQFAKQVLTGVGNPQFGSYGVGDGSPE